MDISKRSDGKSPFWFLRGTDPRDGKRKQWSLKVSGTRSEAQRAALELMASLKSEAENQAKKVLTLSLSEALNRYCDKLSGEKKSSALESRKLAAKTTGALPGRFSISGNTPLESLTPGLMASLVTARQREGNSPQTIANELKLIRAATRYAESLGFQINETMVNGRVRNAWQMPKITMKTRYFSPEEFTRLFDHLSPERDLTANLKSRGTEGSVYRLTGKIAQQRQDAQDLLVMLAMTGARWGEIRGLRWGHVDVDAVMSDGAERPLVRIFGSKTQKERIVAAPPIAAKMLLRRLADLGTRPSPDTLIFPGLDGERSGPCRAISRAIEACGLNSDDSVRRSGRATIHSLRHTYASLLMQRGSGIAEIKEVLGHSTITMTLRYAHLENAENARKQADRLADFGPLVKSSSSAA